MRKPALVSMDTLERANVDQNVHFMLEIFCSILFIVPFLEEKKISLIFAAAYASSFI